jgi:hypothetical protein
MITTVFLSKDLDSALEAALLAAGMTATLRQPMQLNVEHDNYDLLIEICKDYMPPKQAEATEILFSLPVHAPDFIVSSPKVNADPILANDEAAAEGKKPHKSIAKIALSLAHYLEDVEKRLKKGKV